MHSNLSTEFEAYEVVSVAIPEDPEVPEGPQGLPLSQMTSDTSKSG